MEKKYIVVGNGYNSKNMPYSKLAQVVEYKKDDKMNTFINYDKTEYSDIILPIGSIKIVKTSII